MKKFFFILLLSFFLSGCWKKVDDIRLDENPRKAVLSGILKAKDSVTVFLGRVVGIYEDADNDYFLPDRPVVLFDNDILVDTLMHNVSGFYTSPYQIAAGHTYRLEVDAGEYGRLQATTVVPPDVPVHIEDSRVIMRRGDSVIKITYRIDDPPGRGDAYMFELYQSHPYHSGESVYLYPLDISDQDPQLQAEPVNQHIFFREGLGIILSDQAFDGQHTLVTVFYNRLGGDFRLPEVMPHTWHLDRYFYEYLLYRCTYTSQSDQIPVGIMEYMNPEGNVEGGYGFVGSATIRVDTVRLH